MPYNVFETICLPNEEFYVLFGENVVYKFMRGKRIIPQYVYDYYETENLLCDVGNVLFSKHITAEMFE